MVCDSTGRFNIVQDHDVDMNVEAERGFAQISKVGEELVEPNILWVNAHSRDGSGPFLVSFDVLTLPEVWAGVELVGG